MAVIQTRGLSKRYRDKWTVEELGVHRQDLEGYFLDKMGGADHV